MGLTVSDIAKELEISIHAARKRIETAVKEHGIEPITREALWDPSILKILKNVKMGAPKGKRKPKEETDK